MNQKSTRTILLTSLLAATIAVVYFIYGGAYGQLSPSQKTVVNPNISAVPNDNCIDCSRRHFEPGVFLQEGGRSLVVANPDTQKVSLQRGSTATVTLTLTHVSGANPLPVVNIQNIQITNGYIPAYAANLTTPEERATLAGEGKPIPGALDLNSLVSFSTKQPSLAPSESKQILMTITLPKDMDARIIGEDILFSVGVSPARGYDYHELQVSQTWINVHVAG